MLSPRLFMRDRPMRGTLFADLSAFVAVAEHGSFTKAAAQLRVSTGTLSQTIRSLEETLGVRLLNRTTRSVAPTEAGAKMLARLRPLLDEFEAVVDGANAFRDRPAGQLRLTVPAPIASFLLAPLLAQFHAQYPEIVVEISVDDDLVDIVAGRFDAGIRIGGLIARDMIAVRITERMRFVVAGSPDYLARHPKLEKPDDLKEHNCIRVRTAGRGTLPWRFVVDGTPVECEVTGTVITNLDSVLIRAALDGIGLVYEPEFFLEEFIAQGRLVPVLQEWMPPESEGFFLFYPSRRQNPAPLQAMIDFLRTRLKEGMRPAPAARAVDRQEA
jgi:DNA-binding transcriptional LysR family regulator